MSLSVDTGTNGPIVQFLLHAMRARPKHWKFVQRGATKRKLTAVQ